MKRGCILPTIRRFFVNRNCGGHNFVNTIGHVVICWTAYSIGSKKKENLMKFTKPIIFTALLSVVATASFAAEMPTENKGIKAVPLQLQALQQQIPAMAGYVLRSRYITLAPGGSVEKHSHAERPGFLYVLEGELTEYRGDTVRIVRAGESWTEAVDTVHGVRNLTDKPAVAVVIDIVKEE